MFHQRHRQAGDGRLAWSAQDRRADVQDAADHLAGGLFVPAVLNCGGTSPVRCAFCLVAFEFEPVLLRVRGLKRQQSAAGCRFKQGQAMADFYREADVTDGLGAIDHRSDYR